jgi:geranylgeranyl pyrophosphate synthase
MNETLLTSIDAELNSFFEKMKDQGIGWNSEMSAYHFATGGKRLRALIPCWIYSTLGHDPKDAIPLSCALELIHNATLVHDDLQDGDILRRGKETVWKKYSDVQAINCGDALYQFALIALEDLKVSPEVWRKTVRRLASGTLQVIEGQAQEFLMKDEESPTWNRYLKVVEGKTAALISTAVACALEALETPTPIRDSAERAALQSGILFQIQDDLLDIYGKKQRDRQATDIAEGKISARLAQILKTPSEATTDSQIQEALDLFKKYNVTGSLIEKIKTIQSSLKDDLELKKAPELQNFFFQLNQRFLEPIGHLF